MLYWKFILSKKQINLDNLMWDGAVYTNKYMLVSVYEEFVVIKYFFCCKLGIGPIALYAFLKMLAL